MRTTPSHAVARLRGRTGRSQAGTEQAGDVTVTRIESGGEHVRVNTLAGPGDLDFVLVSGIGVASDYYIRLALDLNEVGSVHAIDLPGFAGVRHSGRRLGIEDFADLTEAVLDELGLDHPVLVGHSMGSQVVTEVAARRSSDGRGSIRSLVLIGPVVNASERTVVQQAVRLLLCAGREPFAITLHVLASYVLCGPRWFFTVLPRMMRYPIEDRLPEVEAETLLMRGEHDGNSPADWNGYLAGLAPRAHAWQIPGAAHSVMYAHAREVAQLCLEHLRQTDDAVPDDLLMGDGDSQEAGSDESRPEDSKNTPDASAGTNADSADGANQRPKRGSRGRLPVADIRRNLSLHATTLRDAAARVSGTVMTLRGMLHDDDRLLAEGSRRQLDARRRENARDNRTAPDASQAERIAPRDSL